jgi:hypothetical protein
MPGKPESKEAVNLQELLIAQMIQIDMISMLLIDKGVFTQEEFFEKLKAIKTDYESRKRS